MTLEDLVGEHALTAVEHDTAEVDGWDGKPRPANAIFFTLDGKTYRVTEDEDDGYRSSHRDIEQVDVALKNTFAPVRVLARYVNGAHADTWASSNDLLELIDVVSGKTILLVGTENNDDYYPSYVASFWPERMAINADAAS
jgi:hypothetical protein